MTTLERRPSSPFDSIRVEDPDLGEYWYARELAPLMGYAQWRHFNTVVNKARTTMSADGYNIREHFWLIKRAPGVNVGKPTETPDQGGRPSIDFRLSRHACYFAAMNADPKKPQVALAQQYFVESTLKLEAVQQAVQQAQEVPLPAPAMPSHAEALRGWADALDAQQRAERLVEELRPPAEAWNALAAAGGDCTIAEAASILNRDPLINIGSARLFRWMEEMKVIYRRGDGQLMPYSSHLAHLRLRPRANGSSELRITPDGLVWVQQRLRQQQNRRALTVVPDSMGEVIQLWNT